MASESKAGALTQERLLSLREKFYADDRARLAQNLVCKTDPLEACVRREVIERTNTVFTHKVDETKPVTNQRSSGRCWLFACLNAARIPFVKARNLDDFEFSQAHLFFWDKVERCNYFLHNVVSTARRDGAGKEEVDGRLMSFLLLNPTCDGGQWDMVVNLVKKHGLMPKKCYPETFSCESSLRMNRLLKTKLREYCHELWTMVRQGGASDEAIEARIGEQMEVVYRIAGTCLGVPPETFTWEYYDKAKKPQKVGPISPLAFYEEIVKPAFDMESKVCLVSDPRPQNATGRTYTVDCLGNVVGGRLTVYNNQPIQVLMDVASASIKKGEPVWFGCDVSKHIASKQGIMDLELHDHDLVFGTEINKVLTKAERLVYGDSQMNHAMVLTGIHCDNEDAAPTKWRVENSWGEDRNDKGYLIMTNDWFREFVFEVVVDRAYCSQEILDAFKTDPIVLPAWDPMGELAKDQD